MSFRKAIDFFTFATVLWAFGAMAAFAQLHAIAIVGFLIPIVLAIFRERLKIRIPGSMWLLISLTVLGSALYGWFVIGERLYSVVYLFLYLEVNKLWTGTRTRDVLQVYGLTFFQMLAASVSTSSVFFAPVLAVYLFLILGAMISITMRRDAEIALGAPNKKQSARSANGDVLRSPAHDSRRLTQIYGRTFLTFGFCRWLGVAMVMIICFGSALFFVIPRLQAQSFFQGLGSAHKANSVSGFSDRVEFTGVDRIQLDPTIIMRVKPVSGFNFIGGYPDIEMLRLRGTSLDQYDGRTWTKSKLVEDRFQVHQRRKSVYLPRLAADRIGIREYITEVTLEPNRSGYLFGPDRTSGFHLDAPLNMLIDVESNSLKIDPQSWKMPIKYTVQSVLMPDSGWEMPVQLSLSEIEIRRTGWRFVQRFFSELMPPRLTQFEQIYLRLPNHPDMEIVRRLSTEWTEGMSGPAEKAKAIEMKLKGGYTYSLEVPFASDYRHLTRFLTAEKAGHCEYFATSMALMLRAQGIPARIVNGYATDEWVNGGGGYFIVRREHAHSWVEAYMEGIGWVTYDPTPFSGIGSGRIPRTFYRRVSQLFDSMKIYWYDSVIDYGYQDQAFLYSFIYRSLSVPSRISQLVSDTLSFNVSGLSRGRKLTIFGLLLVLFGLILAFGRETLRLAWRRRVRAKRKQKAGVHRVPIFAYLRLLEEVERHVERRPSQTPLEHARKVVFTNDHLGDFLPLTEVYYSARFNGGIWTSLEDDRANALLRRIRDGGQMVVVSMMETEPSDPAKASPHGPRDN